MKKTDFILITVVLAVAAIAYAFFRSDASDDMVVNVFVDGELALSERLASDAPPIAIETEYGRNVIAITSDGVAVIEADCASQTCVHTGQIAHSGAVIACLPHHLLIKLEGGNAQTEDIDVTSH